jgi:hypothetical protein
MMGGWNYTNDAMPPVGVRVEVWHLTRCIAATWDGRNWRDDAGQPLAWIVNWREYRA